MRECIEEGVLQSYVDGELSYETAESVAAHVAACSRCAEALDGIGHEMAMLGQALEAELGLDVPTARLRERLDAAIAELNPPAQVTERKRGWSRGGWFASFGQLFKVSPQRAVGFAGLIAVIAFAAIFAALYSRRSGDTSNQGIDKVAVNNPTDGNKPKVTTPPVNPSPSPVTDEGGTSGGKHSEGDKNSPGKRQPSKKPSKEVLVPRPDQLPKDEMAGTDKALPGEQNYLKAINSLTAEIEASDVAAMKPSLRAEYERNLAVLNQAIDSTRRVARRNPKDPDAAQFLYSSYQSKVDLLSTVAEQVRPTIATR